MRTFPALTVLTIAASMACKEAPGPTETGSLIAMLSGARSGEFHVTGTLGRDLRASPPPSYFDVFVDGPRLWLAAHRERAYYYDHLLIDIPDYHGVGTYTIRGGITFWLTRLTEARFEIVAGELTITSASSDRLLGTLSGIAVHQPIHPPDARPDTVRFFEGEFDLPVGPVPLTHVARTPAQR